MLHKIFLIEDEPDIVEMYRMAFEESGLEFENALSGGEAVEKIKKINEGKETKPDFILLDLILPDIDGIEILKVIREGEATKEIPVAVLSNYSGDKIKQEVGALKVDEYILKVEVTPQELAERIKEKLKIENR